MSDGRKRYLVLAWRKEGFDAAVIAPHHAHLDALRDQGRLELAGPFSDRVATCFVPSGSGYSTLTEALFPDFSRSCTVPSALAQDCCSVAELITNASPATAPASTSPATNRPVRDFNDFATTPPLPHDIAATVRNVTRAAG